MRKAEKVMLIVFLVISVICGKFLLDYWKDSYDNRQNYQQVEEIAFPEKDTEDEKSESNEDNTKTEIDDFDYQALLDENSDCIGWLRLRRPISVIRSCRVKIMSFISITIFKRSMLSVEH